MADANDARDPRPKPIPTVDTLRWSDDPPRPDIRLDPVNPALIDALRPKESRRRAVAAGAGLALAAVLGGALVYEHGADAARLADPSCWTHEVTRGDTLTSIARNYDTTVDALKAMNPQLAVPSFDRIWPGDHVAIVCLGDAAAPDRGPLPRAEWAAIKAEPYATCVVNGVTYTHCVSAERYIVALFEMGWRGDELVTMAAIAVGEGGGAIDAVGDRNITDATWGPSYGVFQIRAQWAADGSGAPRDRLALWNPADPQASLDHQAWAAREVYLHGSTVTIRPPDGGSPYFEHRPSFKPWTAFLKGWHVGNMDRMRAAAERIGAL